MEIVTTETLPPEASMAGNNTCYCHCQALNKRNNYGVCLFTLKAFEEARLQSESDCYQTISSGNCEARRYRQQERDAGKALFYKKREIPVAVSMESAQAKTFDRNSDSFQRGWHRAGPSKTVVTPIKPAVTSKVIKSKKESFAIKGSLADAVNEAIKQEVSAVQPTTQPVSTNKSLSLLERARLMMTSK